jgi:multidrug efflux pump subunit AcrB
MFAANFVISFIILWWLFFLMILPIGNKKTTTNLMVKKIIITTIISLIFSYLSVVYLQPYMDVYFRSHTLVVNQVPG